MGVGKIKTYERGWPSAELLHLVRRRKNIDVRV
jgi:hypothetical protein